MINLSDNSIVKFKVKNRFSLKKWFSTFDVPRWFAFSLLPMCLFFCGFVIYSFIFIANSETPELIFFGFIDRFTNQSNFLVVLFIFLFVFFPNHSFLKNNSFLISCMCYITFTLLGYNLVLILLGNSGYFGDALEIFINLFVHMITPIFFIIFGIVTMVYRKNQYLKCTWKTMLNYMIYPAFYVVYVITIPFLFTNFVNEKGEHVTYSVYGNPTNVKDNPFAWIYICCAFFIFFPGIFYLYNYLWVFISKIMNKKNNVIEKN